MPAVYHLARRRCGGFNRATIVKIFGWIDFRTEFRCTFLERIGYKMVALDFKNIFSLCLLIVEKAIGKVGLNFFFQFRFAVFSDW